jgi:hypothetical protein
MTVAYGDIARVLDGARRRQLRVVLLAALGFGLAAGLVVLLAGAVALFLGARIGVRSLTLAAAATVLVAAAALAIRALLRTAWSAEAAARTVARDAPALRSDLLSSVELAREREDIQASGRYSVALVDAHLARTAEAAQEVDLARAVPDLWARRGGLALVLALAAHAAAFLLGGGPLAHAYGRVLLGDPPGTAAPAADPITGDIQLTFKYPAYMKREPRTLSGTGGEIRAPKGTEVTLETRADRDVKQAELAIAFDLDPAARGQAGNAQPAGDGAGEAQPRADAKEPAPGEHAGRPADAKESAPGEHARRPADGKESARGEPPWNSA